ncbi:hypothetical protein [Thioalkalivibrio sp. ALMg9]|uniref:hypothetical protein n=1 Tax=Thioalkalivibrio sp. ALMg9 TaxID=1266912 RepID=UPI00037CED77|nr:hypothetical protein [Thioalkalivibrio sp. ALMg9]
MDSDTIYLLYLVIYYVVIFFGIGILLKIGFAEKAFLRSIESGFIWPALLGAIVLIVPAVLPILVSWDFPFIDRVGFDPEEGPFLYGALGAILVFPVLLSLVWAYRVVRWINGGPLVPQKINVTSPSACRSKKDLESVMLCISKKCEKLLSEWYGAEGKGLHEKVVSVEDQLDPQDVKDLRFLASVRNKVTHDEDFDTSTVNRGDILDKAVTVIHRIADKRGVVIGSGFLTILDRVPGGGLLRSPIALLLSFSHATGWLTVATLTVMTAFSLAVMTSVIF